MSEQEQHTARDPDLRTDIASLELECNHLAEELAMAHAELEQLRTYIAQQEVTARKRRARQRPVGVTEVATEWAVGKRTVDGELAAVWPISEPTREHLAPGSVILRREVGAWRVVDGASASRPTRT